MPTPPSTPDNPSDGDIFEDTRHLFHLLNGRLSIILSAADQLREDAHGLSPAQLAEVARLETTAQALQEALANMGSRLLDTLAFTPATRLIWVARCIGGKKIDLAALSRSIKDLGASHPLHTITEVIIVGEAKALPRMRTAFMRLGHTVRMATEPSDVGFLLDETPCNLIAMQPPPKADGHWWRLLRTQLQGSRHQPLLLHLAPIEG
jgi:hypothetical protein